MRRRRGRGEGAIYERSDGQWTCAVSLGYDGEGKRRRRALYARSKKGVQEKLAQFHADTMAGKRTERSKLLLRQGMQRWLDDVVATSLRANTYRSYLGIARNHVLPQLGGTSLGNVDSVAIQNLYKVLEQRGVPVRTRELVHSVLHSFFHRCQLWNLIDRNPCDGAQRPRSQKRTMHTLTKEQALLLLDAARDNPLYALYYLALSTGMRQGELLGLRWCDIDFVQRFVSVQHTMQESGGTLKLAPPKTASSRRRIALSAADIVALQTHRQEQTIAPDVSSLVFCDTRGGPIRKSNLLRRSFGPLLKRAGLSRIRFHDLRHTNATLLLAAGTPVKVVSERLGHADTATTMNFYQHVLPTMQETASILIGSLLTRTDALKSVS
jgi:integrase